MAIGFWITLHTVWFAESVIRRQGILYESVGYAILQCIIGGCLLHAGAWLPFLVGNAIIASVMIAQGLASLAKPPDPYNERNFETSIWRGVSLTFATAIAMALS